MLWHPPREQNLNLQDHVSQCQLAASHADVQNETDLLGNSMNNFS